MTIRVVRTDAERRAKGACYVHDDRRHVYLDADGLWCVAPWYLTSKQEALQRLLMKTQKDACAVQ